MALPSWASDAATVQRGTAATDRYNNPSTDWSDPDEHDLDPCVLQPLDTAEVLSRTGERITDRLRLMAAPDADLLDSDRVRVGSLVYEIDGDVQSVGSPTGRLAHLSALLKRITG